MRFEWDEDKFQSNLRKHGVSFDLATQALLDPFLLEEPERDVLGEERWRVIAGLGSVTLFIVYTLKEDHDETEIFRIISARRASGPEKRRYDEAKNRALRT